MRLRSYISNDFMQLYLELDQRDLFILQNNKRAYLRWDERTKCLLLSPGDHMHTGDTNKVIPHNDKRTADEKKKSAWDGEHRVYISANKVGLPTLRDSEGPIARHDETTVCMINGEVTLSVPVPSYLY